MIIKLISVTAVFVLIGFSACGRSSTESMVTFVDRSTVFASVDASGQTDPLLLLVEIAENGNLSLNKIDVGTTANLDQLSGRLDAIFNDRAQAGIDRRDVLIEMKGEVDGEHFEKLIESLAQAGATPIRVIKGNL